MASDELIAGIEWALSHGWSVIPLVPGSKKPAFKTGPGHQNALSTEGEVASWIANHPDMEACAIRTGGPDGPIVLDVDDLDALQDGRVPYVLPPTLMVQTGREAGGAHFYFASADMLRSFDPAPNVEVKAWGKYVVCPGSKHPKTGAVYRITRGGELLDTPDWFGDWAPAKHEPTERPTGAIAAGGRRAAVVAEAGRLRNSIADESVLKAALWAFNEEHCEPPLRDDVEDDHPDYADIDRIAADFMAKDGYEGTFQGELEGDDDDEERFDEVEREHVLVPYTVRETDHWFALDRSKLNDKIEAEVELRAARVLADRAVSDALAADWEPPAHPGLLAQIEDQDPPEYLIDDLHVRGTNTLLAARYKSGKTTLIDNLARAFADGEDFLGKMVRSSRRMGILDFEMTERQHVDWLRRQGIRHEDRISLWSLRNHPSGFPLWTERAQRVLCEWLTALDIELLVIDTLTAAVGGWPTGGGEPMNSNEVATEWWKIMNRVKEASGLTDLIVVSQYGRSHEEGAERTMGATQWDAGCDTRWIMNTKEKGGNGPREFWVKGRDADLDPVVLQWSGRDENRISVTGTVAAVREHAQGVDGRNRVVQALKDAGGTLATRELRSATKLDGDRWPPAIESLVAEGVVARHSAPRGAFQYTLVDEDWLAL